MVIHSQDIFGALSQRTIHITVTLIYLINIYLKDHLGIHTYQFTKLFLTKAPTIYPWCHDETNPCGH